MTMRRISLSAAVLTACLCAAGAAPSAPLEPVHFRRVKVRGFWRDQFKRLSEKWIPHCITQMEEGGKGRELLNLVNTAKALKGEPAGKFTGLPWSDAYVYNTIESICLALAIDPEGDADLARAQAHLRKKLDEWIPIALAAQTDDGYIHSFHILNKRKRYTNTGHHEFYVQGYFLEAGVAHRRMAGEKGSRLYDAARKCADHLCATFGPPPKRNWIYGHAGMGYALCRLARLVNEVEGAGKGDKYAELAKFFFDHRHTDAKHHNSYDQSHRPVVEMDSAVGHAVRATYFYTGIADLAMLTGDAAYRKAVDRIWDSAVGRKLYVTGGVGASHRGEAFDADYELRNNGYCESCAGCGQSFWADRMHRMHHDGHYVDVQERVLYNNVLGAIELSGVNFFYQNPLASGRGRYPWHGCPCCVGNIPRALLGIKDVTYSLDAAGRTLLVNHYVAGEGTIDRVAGTSLRIEQRTEYPWEGDVALILTPGAAKAFTLRLRIPDRAGGALYTARPDVKGQFTLKVNGKAVPGKPVGGYVGIERTWQAGDRVDLALPMPVQRVYADQRVAADRGRVALQRGPIVYNIESVDHDRDVRGIVLGPDAKLEPVRRKDLLGGVTAVACDEAKLLAIPNYARLNRGGWSQVWVAEKLSASEKVALALAARRAELLDKRTVDKVVIGDKTSEAKHGLKGERTGSGVFSDRPWRDAGGGWFSYDLATDPTAGNVLHCTYWGSDVGNRRFGILVDGKKIATQTLDNTRPGEFFDVEYAIGPELTRGRKKVTVRFQADPGATAGGIFDLRVLRAAPPTGQGGKKK
jgi:DUF1680 family protein